MNKNLSDKPFYDAVINWDKRLKNEIPFLKGMFEKHSCRKILDCACGPGHHVINLCKMGFDTSGSDISKEMICIAKTNAKKNKISTSFFTSDFSCISHASLTGLDAVFCIGNSFSLADSFSRIRQAFHGIRRILKPGGVLIFQVLNYQRIFLKKVEWIPPREVSYKGKKIIVLKRFSARGKKIHVHWINVIQGKSPEMQEKETFLIPVEKLWALSALRKTGFCHIRTYGNYKMEKLTKDSKDLIVVCQKNQRADNRRQKTEKEKK